MSEIDILKERIKKLKDQCACAIDRLNSLINEEIHCKKNRGERYSDYITLSIYELKEIIKELQNE